MSDSTDVGQVVGLEIIQAGGNAVGDHPAGATLLQLDDASDFPELGGHAQVGAQAVEVLSADDETNTLTLAEPTLELLEDGDRVAVLPSSPTTWAQVVVDPDEPALLVEVPFGLKALAGLGAGDLVRFTEDGDSGALRVLEVIAGDPSVDASHIDNAEELLLADQQTLGERLAEDAADLEAARGRLTAAEQRLNDAFSEIDSALQQAIDFATTRTDGLAKILWSPDPPGTTTAPQNSIWYQHASGKIIAVFTQTEAGTAATWVARPITSEAIDNLDVGKLTAATGTVNQLVANTFATALADIIEANIGNLTVTGDAHLNEVVAQRIWGDVASFARVTADQVLAGNIQAVWRITSDGLIVAGDPNGPRAELGPTGLRVFREADGVIFPHSQFTTDDTSLAIYDDQGTALGGITSGGAVTGTSVSTDALAVRGVPVVGTFGGEGAPGWMDRLPWGMQPGWTAASTLATSYKAVNTEWVYVKLRAVVLRADRRYRITASHRAALETTDGVFRSRLRVDRTGGEPGIASEELDQFTTGKVHTGTVALSANHSVSFSPTATGPHSFVITYMGLNGSRCAARSGRILVEDVGPYYADTGGDEGTGSSTTRYTTVWKANAARTYDKTGARIASQDNLVEPWFWFGSPTAFNSPAVLFGAGADRSSHSVEAGKTISAALSGATDVKATLVLKNRHTYGHDDARLSIGNLGAGTLPDTLTVAGSQLSKILSPGATLAEALPASWFTGSNRGVTLGESDGRYGSTALRSAIFWGVGEEGGPELQIEYTR